MQYQTNSDGIWYVPWVFSGDRAVIRSGGTERSIKQSPAEFGMARIRVAVIER